MNTAAALKTGTEEKPGDECDHLQRHELYACAAITPEAGTGRVRGQLDRNVRFLAKQEAEWGKRAPQASRIGRIVHPNRESDLDTTRPY